MSLFSQVRNDWANHGRDWSLPGFRALATHRLGRWCMAKRSMLRLLTFKLLYKYLYRHCRNTYGIEVPCAAFIGQGVIIEHQGGIVVHHLAIIGNNCFIRQGVTIGNRYLNKNNDAPRIGENVNIGAGAKILGDVLVGDDTNIGANAVVINDVPAGATVAGIPATIVNRN